MEPMLLEDHGHEEMPQSIINMLEFFHRSNITPDKNDMIMGLLYISMIESGFIHKDYPETAEDCDFNHQRLLQHSTFLPENWKRTNSYQIDFVLDSARHIICTVFAVRVADDLLINCNIKNIGRYSLLIDPETYFINTKGHFIFQNLDHLARKFKDFIAFPAKIAIVRATGGVCACFQYLPQELQVKIMSYLDISNVLSLAQTCRNMWRSAQDSSLWVKLLDRDFRKRNVVKSYEELKFIYEIKYARQLSKMDKRPV